MTNVIPLKPNGEGLNPSQMINRLHALCEELQHVKSEALHLETCSIVAHSLRSKALCARSATQTIVLVSTAIDVVVDAVAELIVETTAELIAPPSPANN